MKHASTPFSFSILLAGVTLLSGLFVTQAIAQDESAIPEEVHFESSVVSETLSFIAEQGASEGESEVVPETQVNVEVSSETSVRMSSSFTNTEEENCSVPPNQSPRPVTLVITKIKCTNESDLPNWGLGGPNITAHTATNFLADHPSCVPVDHWGFEWGNQHVTNPGDDYLWDAGVSSGWTSLGVTNAQGVLTAQVTLPSGTSEIRVREILEPGYLPFSYGLNGKKNTNSVSAELYCANDVENYDNFDFVRNPVPGQTYHCVAWNVRNSAVNHPPSISLLGQDPMTITIGGAFTDPGATATDQEDGTLVPVVSGAVDTGVLGTYTLVYTATDSGGLLATTSRRVNVIPPGPSPLCSDGIDNDNDHLVDFPLDLGCESAVDNDENNPPAITLLGANPMTLVVGTPFVDPGATATDVEDGTIVPSATGTVGTATGTYVVVYTATDSKGLTAVATRTVNVVPPGETFACSDGIDNDTPADGAVDFPADAGCSSATDDDENNAPVITRIGADPVSVIIGNTYTDAGATATDAEDGEITTQIVATGTVDTATLGAYTIRYNVTDSDGASATEVTRTVNVMPVPVNPPTGGGGGGTPPAKCANGQDDDADGKADYPLDPGCTNSLDNDETDTTGGGGGGVGTPGLQIFNERLTVLTPTSVKITWNTNLLSDSRVVYGDLSKNPAGLAPQYGYANTTATATAATSTHEMVVTGLPTNSVAFFRPVSSNGASTVVGVELVTPLVAGSCTYLEKYLRLGYDNDPVEVTKLQRFLKEYEGFTTLAVTGIFDIETDKAVRAFQDKYKADVLTPWNLPTNTGYVYYTTQKKVNEIYCKRAFPLTSAQLLEINAYANATSGTVSLPGGSVTSVPVTQPTVTVVRTPGTRPTPSPVVDLSKIDLSDMTPKAPVVILVPEEGGEIAGGVNTDEPNVAGGQSGSWLSRLRAALSPSAGTDETVATATESEADQGDDASVVMRGATSSSLIASAAASLGVSTGTLAVWAVLFAVIVILGYVMARRNRQSLS